MSKSLFKFSTKSIVKKIKFLMKPKNINKILILLAALLCLYLLHKHYLAKEGFEASADDLEDQLREGKTLVMFYADWCGHCQKIKPIWDESAKEINESASNSGVKLIKVNCGKPNENESHKQIMQKYEIQGFPTIKLFEDGEVVQDFDGNRTKEGIRKFLGLDDNNVVESFSNKKIKKFQQQLEKAEEAEEEPEVYSPTVEPEAYDCQQLYQEFKECKASKNKVDAIKKKNMMDKLSRPTVVEEVEEEQPDDIDVEQTQRSSFKRPSFKRSNFKNRK